MKKLLLALMILVMAGCISKAPAADLPSADLGNGTTIGLNNMEAGTYYDVKHRQILAGMQVSVVDYKQLVSFDVGVLTDAHTTPWFAGIGVDVSTLAKMCKLNYNLPGPLHLTTFVARDLTESWKDGGRWGIGAVVRF